MSLMKYQQIKPEQIDPYLDSEDWDLMQKLDGMRARLVITPSETKVLGNNGMPSTSTAIAPTVAKLYDFGEAYRKANQISEVIKVEGEIVDGVFWIFDLPQAGIPWHARRDAMLSAKWPQQMGPWARQCPVFSTPELKRRAWERIVACGVEGAVLKHHLGLVDDSGKRVPHVLKCKLTHTVDCFVLDRGSGNGRNGTDNWLAFGLFDSVTGQERFMGRCSTIGKPYADIGDVIEVKYLYVGAGGKLVQPTHLRNRPDKTIDECTTDQLHYVSKHVITENEV